MGGWSVSGCLWVVVCRWVSVGGVGWGGVGWGGVGWGGVGGWCVCVCVYGLASGSRPAAKQASSAAMQSQLSPIEPASQPASQRRHTQGLHPKPSLQGYRRASHPQGPWPHSSGCLSQATPEEAPKAYPQPTRSLEQPQEAAGKMRMHWFLLYFEHIWRRLAAGRDLSLSYE